MRTSLLVLLALAVTLPSAADDDDDRHSRRKHRPSGHRPEWREPYHDCRPDWGHHHRRPAYYSTYPTYYRHTYQHPPTVVYVHPQRPVPPPPPPPPGVNFWFDF